MAVAEEFINNCSRNGSFWVCALRYWVRCCWLYVDSVHFWLFCVVSMGIASLGKKARMGLEFSEIELKRRLLLFLFVVRHFFYEI